MSDVLVALMPVVVVVSLLVHGRWEAARRYQAGYRAGWIAGYKTAMHVAGSPLPEEEGA